MPHKPGSWRIPIAIGVTFWLWANIDAWFILGPLAVGLILVGELIQTRVLNRPETDDPATDPLGRPPDVPTLTRALIVGLVACSLTPHHVRVWELPFELVGSDAIKTDPTMDRNLNLAPTDSIFTERPEFGYNLNGLAYVVLVIGGGAVLGFGVGRLRVSHLTLWVGFTLISLVSVFAIPFFAVAAVPLVAAQLNAVSARITLGKGGDRQTRFLVGGSAVGRVLCLAALVAGIVCAWPGWLHPPGIDGIPARRVSWAVEPDPALVAAATQFQDWRTSGALPPNAHGLIASVALSDYCAWYAPDEKVFLNSRFAHHRPELPDYVGVRGAAGLIDRPDEPPSSKEVAGLLKKRNAVYLAVYNSRGQVGTRISAQRQQAGDTRTAWQFFGWDDWATWYVDGRTLVMGWLPGAAANHVAADRVRVDPLVRAFGPNPERVPPGRVVPAPSVASWTTSADFFRPLRGTPAAADEALGWLEFKRAIQRRQADVFQVQALMHRHVPRVFVPRLPLAGDYFQMQNEVVFSSPNSPPPPTPDPQDGTYQAIPVLAVRAARRAIAADPNHPDGYYALAQALADTDLPLSEGERVIGQITAYRQCLDRFPPPSRFRPADFRASPTGVAEVLSRLYLGVTPDGRYSGIPLNLRPHADAFINLVRIPIGDPQGRQLAGRFIPFDIALKTLERARDYFPVEYQAVPADLRKKAADQLDGQIKLLDRDVRNQFATYDQQRERAPGVIGQYQLALRLNLIGEAIRLVRESPDLEKDFGRDQWFVAIQVAGLELCVGRLEEATGLLGEMREKLDKPTTDPMLPVLKGGLRLLEFHQASLAGNYAAAARILDDFAVRGAETRPPFPAANQVVGAAWPVWVAQPAGFETPITVALPIGPQLVNYFLAREQIGGRMAGESEVFLVAGILALIEGDIPTARGRFLQCFRPPPPGWNMPNFNRTEAMVFLELIEMAQVRAAAK